MVQLQPSRRSLSLTTIIFLICGGLIILHYVGVLRPIEGLLARIFSPLQSSLYSAGTVVSDTYRPDTTGLSYEELESGYQALLAENALLKQALNDVQEVDLQQTYLESAGYMGVQVRVLGKRLEPDSQILIINKGARDGIKVGQPVITQNGILIGTISNAQSAVSHIQLLNDSHSAIAVVTQSDSPSKGVVVGDRGLSLKMEFISQDDMISTGDVVVTLGTEPHIPPGLTVGQVEYVTVEQNTFFQTAFLRPLVTIDELTLVSVIISDYDI